MGDAMREFNSEMNTTTSSNFTTSTSGKGKISSGLRAGSQNKDQNIMDVLLKAEMKTKMGQLPAL